MKIFIADSLSEKGLTVLKNEPGIEANMQPGLKPEEIIKLIGDYDALIVRSGTTVTEEIIEAVRYLEQPDFYIKGEDVTDSNIWLGAADDIILSMNRCHK